MKWVLFNPITNPGIAKADLLQQELRKYSKPKNRSPYKSRGAKELVSQGLLILERLTQDQRNCTEISKDQGLLSKITSPLTSSSADHGDLLTRLSADNTTTVEMLSRSLTVLSRVLTSPGDDTARLRQKLATNTQAVSNLLGILEGDSGGAQKLHGQALEILTELALDGSLEEVDFHKLLKALLLRIFLEEEASSNVTEQWTNNNATSQVEIEHEQAGTETAATRLRGNAGEALARLLPVHAARGILSKQEATSLLNKVLHKILSSKMRTTLEIVVVNLPQEDADTGTGSSSAQPPMDENEKQSEERKSMAAMLSLAVAICNENMVSEEGFAYATPGDAALAKKLKEIVKVNEQSTAECLRIVKLVCQLVVAMVQVEPGCIAHFNGLDFMSSLTEALETMSEIDDCMLFAGNEHEVTKPARSLASLVKEAQGLLNTAQG
ncbi:uncharacterized protein [Zea mays]|nr:uncharacterized protein LOC103631890 [Zea mays]XP_020397004.1 uncharacterized protein LOC103631890 [Zea mays]|eukprot:XP_008651949.1 uncharacterized protein LOC103631890 [Zea mays]